MPSYFRSCLMAVLVLSAPVLAQTAARPPRLAASTKPAPTTAQAAATARRQALETQLKSSDKSQVIAAFDAYKSWFKEDAKAGERAFWESRATIMPMSDYATTILELIDLGKKYKTDAKSGNIGYLFALSDRKFDFRE